jgi:large subunit ribosomal protein L25
MESKRLTIEPRTDMGKNASRRLRVGGYIPGVLYSHGETEAVQIQEKDFFKLFKGKISESVIFDLHSASKKDLDEKMAYVKDYQRDPVTNQILHVDLFKVTATEKIHTNVPVIFVGTSAGAKMGGILEVEAREVLVECLPRDLPEKIEIDVSKLDIGDAIHVHDIDLGEKVRIMLNPEAAIVTVIIPKIAVVEEKVEEAAVAAEGEEAKEEEKAEGEPEEAKEKEKEKKK